VLGESRRQLLLPGPTATAPGLDPTDRRVTTALVAVCDRAIRPITIVRMNTLYPWQLLVVTLAGWTNRYQQKVADYLVEENRVLQGQLRGKRVRLSDDERRRLAVKGKAIGRRALDEVASIVTPDTILRWYRSLIARKWDYSSRRKKPGRPTVAA
jgi:hypothetical protein